METNKNIMPDMDLFPHLSKAIKTLGNLRSLGSLLCRHQLASHGDHFVHPLDDVFDAEPYTDAPVQESLFNMNQMYFPETWDKEL